MTQILITSKYGAYENMMTNQAHQVSQHIKERFHMLDWLTSLLMAVDAMIFAHQG